MICSNHWVFLFINMFIYQGEPGRPGLTGKQGMTGDPGIPGM